MSSVGGVPTEAVSHPTARPVLALAVVAIDGLGLAQLAAPDPTEQAHASASTERVKRREFRFTLTTKSAARPVTVTFTNVGTVAHDFSIAGKTTPLVQPGHTAKLVVRFRKTGRFSYLRTVPGPAAAGMRGVFTVR